MDEPFQLVYEEIMRAFPKTKFVLTISDPERWYESYTELIAGMEETENRTHDRYLPSGFRSWLESDVDNRVHSCALLGLRLWQRDRRGHEKAVSGGSLRLKSSSPKCELPRLSPRDLRSL